MLTAGFLTLRSRSGGPGHTDRLSRGTSAVHRLIQPTDQIHIIHLRKLELLKHQIVNHRGLQLLELAFVRHLDRLSGHFFLRHRLKMPVQVVQRTLGLDVFLELANRRLQPTDLGVLPQQLAQLSRRFHNLIVRCHDIAS